MALAEIVDSIERAYRQGLRVVRLHSGDLSIWSAMGEQLHALRARGIPVTLTPGVPAFAAAAAALQLELTVPWASQSVVLTRLGGRASPVPDSERLEAFAATGATLAIHLSVHRLREVVQRLLPYYGADCPAAVVWRASWPDERVLRARLGELQQGVEDTVQRTALILVGRNLDLEAVGYSRLYAADYERRFRPLTAHAPASGQAQE
jgi:precorrin-4/cobalt-precorrin-4 C11-methyltransferase